MEKIKINSEMMDSLNVSQVLADMQVGFWVIEFPEGSAPKMYGNATMYTVLGIDGDSLTPEEVYAHWSGNIDPAYSEIVAQTVEAIKKGRTSEVKYLWHHQKKGWLWVRCGGYLDETYRDGFRFQGWHYDITNELESEVIDSRHSIADARKLKLYAPYIIENIEELYEIDCKTLNVNTIFYEKDKYCQIDENKNILFIIKEQVHPDYADRLSSVFQPESLHQMVKEKQTKQIECKVKTASGEYSWAEVKIFSVNIAENSKLLFCVHDISDKKRVVDLTNEKNEIIDAFYHVYSSIAELNLRTEQVCILKSDIDELNQLVLPLRQLYRLIEERFVIAAEKNTVKHFFDIDNLKSFAQAPEHHSFDFQLKKEDGQFKWKRVEVLRVPYNKHKLYLVVSDVDENHILDAVLKHFVFDSNDYLYYVDVKNNSFLSFYKNDENIVLPPQSGDDYQGALNQYNETYVVAEDRERATALMQPDYMVKRLQQEDSYKFDAGMLDMEGRYRRKEITIQRYDQENQIIFISRKDITKAYFNQKNQKESLATAHRMVNTDVLTNLFNRNGAYEKIEKRLSERTDETDAFIIIDLDNFKAVNDTLGHMRGDRLLQDVARILERHFRKSDITARLGGDEFIVYMKDIRTRQDAGAAVETLLHEIQLTCRGKTGNIDISISAGIAMAPADGHSFEELYEKSDKALYLAKRRGKNCFLFFSPDKSPV